MFIELYEVVLAFKYASDLKKRTVQSSLTRTIKFFN